MGYAGVSFNEIDDTVLPQVVPGTRIAVCLRALMGPIAEATLVRSWSSYKRIFGGLSADWDDAHWAQFALNSGCELIVSRIVHATDPDDISTITCTKAAIAVPDRDTTTPAEQTSNVGPFVLAHGDDLVMDINGVPELAITISAVAADVESTALGDFTGGKVLNVKVNRGSTQYIPFINGDFANPAIPTADEIAIVINREGVGLSAVVVNPGLVTMYSDRKGSGSYIQVTGGTANALLSFPTTEQSGSGNVVSVTAVTADEIVTLLQALANEGTTWYAEATSTGAIHVYTVAEGSAVYIGFDAPSLMAAKLGWTAGVGGDVYGTDASGATSLTIRGKYYGTYAAGIRVTVQDNPADATRFDVIIPVQSGTGYSITTEEKFESLTVDNADARYAINIVNNSSSWIELVDGASPSAAPADEPLAGTYTLTGGNNGLAGLVAADFLGGSTSHLGVHAFDSTTYVKDGCMDLMTPLLPTLTTPRNTMYQIAQYTAARKDMVYHMTNPDGDSVADALAFRNSTGAYVGGTKFNTTYATLYTVEGKTTDDLSSGEKWLNAAAALAGVLAYTDRTGWDGGPWQAPCGAKRGKTRFLAIDPNLGSPGLVDDAHDCEDAQINRLADFGKGPIVEDQQTLQYGVNSAFNALGCRRGAIAVEQRTVDAVREQQWEIVDPVLWRAMYNAVKPIWDDFKSKRGCYDYRILCDQRAATVDDAVIHTADDIDNGRARMKIYYKPARHAREILIEVIATKTSTDFSEMEV